MFVPKDERDVAVCLTEADHFWRPITDLAKNPTDWQWTCVNCTLVVGRMPGGVAPQISQKDLESMIDSSLKLADKVFEDDQSVKGELWTMRSCRWLYYPYRFHVVYHVCDGVPFVMLFRFQKHSDRSWGSVVDTETYRQILRDADAIRRII